MPEAVIAAAARSPIGRAVTGSPTDLRPDDLTAVIITAAFHDKQSGLETMCLGGGQGMALVLERLS